MTKPALIAVVGPTGTGKSDLAIKIAHALAASGRTAEIVNSDAMQLYRGMDIGTAKLSVAARAGVVHHLIDVYPVTKESTAAGLPASALMCFWKSHSHQIHRGGPHETPSSPRIPAA